MAIQEIDQYVLGARNQGFSDEQIKTQLLKAGWDEKDILVALTPKLSTQVLPPSVSHFSMWVTFQYVILFISLYVSMIALGGIAHFAVDQLIQDNLRSYADMGSSYTIKWYLAAIVVSFPIFSILFLTVKRQELVKPAIKNIKSRKLLIYLTLIATFLVIIWKLITTIFNFLDGSLTTRTLAHILVTAGISGSMFFYYILEIKEDRKMA